MTARHRDLPLTLSAVAGALVLVAMVVLAVTHSRPVAFRSGSMSPTIPTGAVALVHRVPAADLRSGDVVTVSSGTSYVTHRIVQLTRSDGRATLQLKGDANPVPDADLHEVSSAERVVASVPWLGYLLGGLTGPAGLALLGVYAVWLFRRVLRGAPTGRRERPSHRGPTPSGQRQRRRLAVGAVAVAAATSTLVATAPRVWAANVWPDDAVVSGTALSAYTVPPPTLSCSGGIASVTFNWTAVPGATGYVITIGGTARAEQTTTTLTIFSVLGSGTATVVARRAFGSPVTTTWTSVASNSVRYNGWVCPA